MKNRESEDLLQQALLNPSFCEEQDPLAENGETANSAQPSQTGSNEASFISNFFRNPLRRNEILSSPDSLSEGRCLSPSRHLQERLDSTSLQCNDIGNVSVGAVDEIISDDDRESNTSYSRVVFSRCKGSLPDCGVCSSWIFLGLLLFWSVGIYSFVTLMNSSEESTNFASLFRQQSNRIGLPSELAHAAFMRAYPSSIERNSSVFVPADLSSPVVVVLNGTTGNRSSNKSASNDKELSLCSSRSKFARRGTPMYALGRNFSFGLEPFVRVYMYQHLKRTTRDSEGTGRSMLANASLPFVRILSYYTYIDEGLDWLANAEMATEDGSSVIIQVFSLNQYDDLDHVLIRAVDAYTTQFLAENMNSSKSICFSVESTGSAYFGRDLNRSIHHIIWIIIVLVVPFSILTASMMVSYQYHATLRTVWIIPTVTILSTLCLECIVAHILLLFSLYHMTIFGIFAMIIFSAEVSMNCSLYLLFLYSDMGSSQGKSRLRALMSSFGVFIPILWLFLVFDIPILRDVFLGTFFGVSAAIILNFTMIPTLLAVTSLGKMTTPALHPLCVENCSSICNGVHEGMLISDQDSGDVPPPESLLRSPSLSARCINEPNQSFSSQMLPSPSQSAWFNVARNLIHPYRGLILLLILLQLILPVSYQLKHAKFSIRLEDVLPRNCACQQTYKAVGEHLGWGRVQPHRILFDGDDANVSMTSKTGFEVMHFVLDQLRQADTLSQSQRYHLARPSMSRHRSVTLQHSPLYYGISIVRDTVVSHDLFLAAQFCTAGLKRFRCPLELLRLISATNELVTSTDSFATYLSVLLPSDPFSNDGLQWLIEARDTVNRMIVNHADLLMGVRIYVDGPAGVVYDKSNTMYMSFPTAMCVSIFIVIFFVAIIFQSLALAVRCVLMNGISFTFSMGLLVSLYQKGFLSGTANGGDVGCCWLVPLMAFPVIVGLGIPGDFLIMHRILEYQLLGYERKSSIALGLAATGSIVCSTGCIVAVIVGAPLAVSCSLFMKQLSFVVTVSVLLNGFVLQTLLAPAVAAFIPFFWWPRTLSEEKFCLDEFSNRNPFQMESSIDGQHSAGTYWEALVSSSEYEPLSPYR